MGRAPRAPRAMLKMWAMRAMRAMLKLRVPWVLPALLLQLWAVLRVTQAVLLELRVHRHGMGSSGGSLSGTPGVALWLLRWTLAARGSGWGWCRRR